MPAAVAVAAAARAAAKQEMAAAAAEAEAAASVAARAARDEACAAAGDEGAVALRAAAASGFTAEALAFARSVPDLVREIEHAFDALIGGGERRRALRPMPREHRRLTHELAHLYFVGTIATGVEPHRFISLVRTTQSTTSIQTTLHPLCTHHAPIMHPPCTHRASTVHHRAHAVHMPCACRAHAVHMPCACRAHAVHVPLRAPQVRTERSAVPFCTLLEADALRRDGLDKDGVDYDGSAAGSEGGAAAVAAVAPSWPLELYQVQCSEATLALAPIPRPQPQPNLNPTSIRCSVQRRASRGSSAPLAARTVAPMRWSTTLSRAARGPLREMSCACARVSALAARPPHAPCWTPSVAAAAASSECTRRHGRANSRRAQVRAASAARARA